MAFQDEELIAQRAEAKRKRDYTIENEVVVDGVTYQFARRKLFEDTISIVVPESFEVMKPQVSRMKFPNENRPQIILCSENGGTTLSFSRIPKAVEKSAIKQTAEQMRAAIKRMNPAFVFQEQGDFDVSEELHVAWFTFISYAVDIDLFNQWFAANLENELLIGSFGCSAEIGDAWQPLVEQMLRSIVDETKPKEEKK